MGSLPICAALLALDRQIQQLWAGRGDYQEIRVSEMDTDVISKPLYQILSDLTRESRLEVALPLAIKDLIRLKLKEASEQREAFERRYGMDFRAFKQAWQDGHIADRHSYEVERDYWEWEAAVTDEERLHQMSESLP
jgi:hypothetical protein